MKKLIALAAFFGTTTLAHAQDAGLTVDDVQAFLAPLAENAEAEVAAGDWTGVQDWMVQHVADEAPLQFTGGVLMSQGPSTTFTATMTGADLKAFSDSAMMGMKNDMDLVEDYTLEVRVMDVWQMPGGFVSAAVAFYEHGLLNAPEGSPVSGPFASATEGALRMASGDDAPQIVLANCTVDANI